MNNKVRKFEVKIRDRVAGHGMTLPSYELAYDGWSIPDPPKYVIEYLPTIKVLEVVRENLFQSLSTTGSGTLHAKLVRLEIERITTIIKEIEDGV